MRPLGFLLLLCVIVALQLQLASSRALPSKPGCPKPSSYGGCQYNQRQRPCADDSQCRSSERCCETGCQMLCMASGFLANLHNPMNYAINGPFGK